MRKIDNRSQAYACPACGRKSAPWSRFKRAKIHRCWYCATKWEREPHPTRAEEIALLERSQAYHSDIPGHWPAVANIGAVLDRLNNGDLRYRFNWETLYSDRALVKRLETAKTGAEYRDILRRG